MYLSTLVNSLLQGLSAVERGDLFLMPFNADVDLQAIGLPASIGSTMSQNRF